MNKKFFTMMAVLLITVLLAAPVAAKGLVQLGGSVSASWPLHLDGTMTGLGGYTQGVVVSLQGFGQVIDVTCTNQGGNMAPGQNPGKISVYGSEDIGSNDISKKGTADVLVLADQTNVAIQVCPNGNWTAAYNVDWKDAIVQVFDKATSELLLWQHYACAPNLSNPGHYLCTLDNEINYH